MDTEKGWVSFNATLRRSNRITVKPEVRKALGLKEGDMLNLKVRKMELGEVE